MNKSSLPVVPAHVSAVVLSSIMRTLRHGRQRTVASIRGRIKHLMATTYTSAEIQAALELEITTRPGGVSRVRLVSPEELQKPQAERLWEPTPL